jgi:DNA-directed RNA polymerase specialized sigma24 family protein
LHRFGGLTYEQIAEETGISRSMVARHISSVLLELDDKFEKEK